MTRNERATEDLPSIIHEQVGEQMKKLENRLLKNFEDLGQSAIEESTSVLNETLNGRIETLEEVSAIQTRTLVNLRDASKLSGEKVSSAVSSIEKTLVPGRSSEGWRPAGWVITCPHCASTRIRRAYRTGFWEECLRLFFIAPFRCRACRRKFYHI